MAARLWQPAEPAPPDIAELNRVLCVLAHPDDVDFAAAGTVAALTSRGVTVEYCVLTDGEQGGYDQSISRPAMAATRRTEQLAAAAAVGVTEVTFLGWPDGALQSGPQLRRAVTEVL